MCYQLIKRSFTTSASEEEKHRKTTLNILYLLKPKANIEVDKMI